MQARTNWGFRHRRRVVSGPTTIVSDAFTRTAASLGTADTGQAWAISTGAWSTNGSQATTATVSTAAFIDSATANRTISVTLADLTGGHGLVFMYADASNFYRYYYSGGLIFVQSVIAGTGGAVITQSQTLSAGDVLKVIISGGLYTCQVNGVTVTGAGNLTPNVALAGNTKDGLYVAGTAGGLFDNYLVTAP